MRRPRTSRTAPCPQRPRGSRSGGSGETRRGPSPPPARTATLAVEATRGGMAVDEGGALAPVPVSASRTVRSELVFPNDANPAGNIFGGRVLMLMDVVGAIAARRHSRRQVVTAEIDSVDFLRPIRVGECIELVAEVSAVGRTCMEVEVRAYVEDLAVRQPCWDPAHFDASQP
ncbi:MAG: hypothetical protein K6V73_10260 [Firmicutes bacterium]|nr:hypothetical protein [Bacillota bacterium]